MKSLISSLGSNSSCSARNSLVVKRLPLSNNNVVDYSQNKKIASTFLLENEFLNLLENAPSMVSWKDADSVFLGCNYPLAILGKLKSPKEIIGKKDADFPWGENGYSEIFKAEDEEVLSGMITFALGRYKYFDKERIVMVKKIPIQDAGGNIVGVLNFSNEFYRTSLLDIIAGLRLSDIEISVEIIQYIKTKLLNIGDIFSAREEECCYYLLKGLTAKEIGKILGISFRTVETYLNNIKDKLECRKTASLIAKTFELGYADNIPTNILLQKMKAA